MDSDPPPSHSPPTTRQSGLRPRRPDYLPTLEVRCHRGGRRKRSPVAPCVCGLNLGHLDTVHQIQGFRGNRVIDVSLLLGVREWNPLLGYSTTYTSTSSFPKDDGTMSHLGGEVALAFLSLLRCLIPAPPPPLLPLPSPVNDGES